MSEDTAGRMRLEAEQRRGREIAARHHAEIAPELERREREEVLKRLVESGEVKLVDKGKNREAWLHTNPLDPVLIIGEVRGPAWPSIEFVTHCTFAVAAAGNWNAVPDHSYEERQTLELRKQREEYKALQRRFAWKQLNEPDA